MKVLVVAIFFVAFVAAAKANPAKGRSSFLPPGGTKPEDCNRPNEFYDCGIACQTECATLGEKCIIDNIKCNEWCYCKEGYARDADWNCIPVSQCAVKQSV